MQETVLTVIHEVNNSLRSKPQLLKNTINSFYPWSAHACFLREKRVLRVPLLTLPFCRSFILKKNTHLSSRYDFAKEIWLKLLAFRYILIYSQPVLFLIYWQLLEHQFLLIFRICNWVVGILRTKVLFRQISSAIIRRLKQRSLAITTQTNFTLFSQKLNRSAVQIDVCLPHLLDLFKKLCVT